MSLETLRQAFTPNEQQVTDLTVAKLPSITNLLARIDLQKLTFTQARVIVGSTSVTLVGLVAWRDSSGTASLVGTDDGVEDRLVFDLDISTPTPWTFGVAFPVLPGMWRKNERGIEQAPSFLPAVQVKLPSIHATNEKDATGENALPARITGWLPLIGDLESYRSYVGPGDLGLDGTLTFVDGSPQLELDAMSDSAPGRPNGFSGTPMNGIGLRLTTQMPDDLALEPGTKMSALLLITKLSFGDKSVEITCPLLWGDNVWPLYANLWQVKPNLSDGLASLSELFGLPENQFKLPPAIDFVDQFYLAELGVGLIPPAPDSILPGVQYLRAVTGSDHEWSPPIPYVRVGGVGASWLFNFWGQANKLPDLSAQVWGEMRLGAKSTEADPIIFKISVDYPTWVIEGKLLAPDGTDQVPMKTVFEAFNFKGAPDTGLAIHHLSFRADPSNQTFDAKGAIAGNWPLSFGGLPITLTEIGAWINASQSRITGGVDAFFYVDPTGQSAVFALSAEYLSSGRWRFTGGLEGQLSLVDLLSKVFGTTPPDWVHDMDLRLTKLNLMLDTGTGDGTDGSYSAEGAVVAKWHINALGISDLSLSAEASVSKSPEQKTADRRVRGVFSINKIVITAGVDLSQNRQTYLFSIRYNQLELLATTAWSGEGQPKGEEHQVLNVQLRGVTLGDILTYFVQLASPASEFCLEAPWDLLNKIDLADFLLTLDKFNSAVTLNYSVEADFGFIYVKTVGVRYSYAGKGKVDLILTGRILDQKYGYDGEPPLAWDVVDDPPPTIPGKGPRYLDLRYLGVGQHVTLKNMRQYTTLEQVITALREDMRPVDDPNQSPIGQPQVPDLVFDDVSQWMIGLDFTLIDMLSVGLVLHDPDLYGILIALKGPSAGSLAGLSFELLYRKVTNDIGVFRVQLKVPDMFRQIDIGTVSITLGVITVEVYTNGNFSVDLGFPHNRSFAGSFAVQVFPFIGRGGLYFASLTGATSKRVPVITNGNFDPVLELGIGLAVGLGKEFNKGPLNAGLYVELEVIIEGVLAWFHPSDAAIPTDRYYWVQGLAGVTGKLYGNVDFKVVKVSVSVELHAYVMVTMEAYKATLIELEVGVEAHASIKILFIRLSFSFSFTVHESFTLGHDSRSPWILAGNQPGGQRVSFRGAAVARRRNHADIIAHTRRAYLHAVQNASPHLCSSMANDPYILDWNADLKVFPDQAVHPSVLRMVVLPAIDQMVVAFAPARPDANATPAYRVSIVLTADTGDDEDHSPQALLRAHPTTRTGNVSLSAHASDVPDLSLNVLIEGLLRWALAALPDDAQWPGVAVAGEIDILAELINDPRTAEVGFAMANLSTFLGNNIALRVCLPPTRNDATILSGATFPMPPVVSWTADLADRNRDFATFNMVDSSYERMLSEYFGKLDPLPRTDRSQGSDPTAFSESVASFVFRDSLLMLTKSAVQEAQTLMRQWPYQTVGGESLADVGGWFDTVEVQYLKSAGDTLDQVAAHFGLSLNELLLLNPGIQDALNAALANTTIPVILGVTAMSIAAANANTALADNNALPIGNVLTQVAEAIPSKDPAVPTPVAETLSALAARFGKTAEDVSIAVNQGSAKLLRAGASIDVSALAVANPNGLSIEAVAAVLFVRLFGIDAVPSQDYQIQAQLISESNPKLLTDVFAMLTVAEVNLTETAGDVWNVQVGDSLARIAATMALLRGTPPALFLAFETSLKAVNPNNPANPVLLPVDTFTAIGPGEAMADVSLRLLLPSPDAVIPFIATADVLVPLAVVVVPGVFIAVTSADTIGSIAKAYAIGIEDLGEILADRKGLFDGTPSLAIPHIPAVSIDKLVDTLQRSHSSIRIAGMVSNFLMHGLRPPAPGGDHAPAALHDIIGQQIAPDASTPMTLRLGAASDQSWLAYFLTDASRAETLTEFATRNDVPLAQVETLNPGASARYGAATIMPPGLVLITQHADSASTAFSRNETIGAFASRVDVPVAQIEALNPSVYAQYGADNPLPAGLSLVVRAAGATAAADLVIDQTQLTYPDATVQMPTVRAPMAMPLAKAVPMTYGLQQHIVWQAGATPWTTGANNVSPSLWPFPVALLARAAKAPTYGYELVANAVQSGAAHPSSPTSYAWATKVDIAIRRTTVERSDGNDNEVPPNTYEVIGLDTAARQLLLKLWQDLPASGGANLQILYTPSLQSDRSSGLASAILDPTCTFIIKTNLSTETASGQTQMRMVEEDGPILPISGADFAQIDAPRAFLSLLWECSVVGGGGYTLGYASTDGSPLPSSLFDSEGAATITLLVIPDPQVRTLKPYFNCAAVGDNVDPSSLNLAVQSVGGAETSMQPTVWPGHVGFDFALSNPDLLSGQTPTQKLARQSYSLACYALGDTAAFFASDTAMPVGPQVTDPQALSVGRRALRDESTWYYHQVIPIHRYAKVYFAPAHASLPKPASDPYAGIAALWSPTSSKSASTSINLWFQDLIGNISRLDPTAAVEVNPMVGYTDALKSPGQWPNMALGYQVAKNGAGANLSVALGLQLNAYMPGAGDAPDAAVAVAASHRTAFGTIHFQLAQPDIRSVLTTNLAMKPGSDPCEPILMDGGLNRLRALVAGTYAFLDLVAGPLESQPGLTPVWVDTAMATTFDQILQSYGLTTDGGDTASGYELLARANALQPLARMLWGSVPPADATLSIPVFRVVSNGASLAQIFTTQAIAIAALSQPSNAHLPLSLSQTLKIPTATKPIADPVTSTLWQIGQALTCSPIDIALTNRDATGLLRAGFAFSYAGVTARVGLGEDGKTVSLQAMADAFTDRGYPVNAVDLASFNQYTSGMLGDGAQVAITTYIVQPLDTVAVNGAKLSVADMVGGNFDLPNLFDAGTPVHTTETTVDLPATQSLEQFATAQGITSVQLMQSLSTRMLSTQSAILVPGAASWSQKVALQVPYYLREEDTLDRIAQSFGISGTAVPGDLAESNADLPGVLASKPITINGISVTPIDGSSFNDVVADFKASGVSVDPAGIAHQISSTPGYLSPGGLLICPLSRLGEESIGLSLSGLQAKFGISASDFAAANAAMPGLLMPDVPVFVTISNPSGEADISISTMTRHNDTFNSLSARFTAMGASVSVTTIAAANVSASLINPAAAAVLPPAPVKLVGAFGPDSDGVWHFAKPIFEIEVALTLGRDAVLVNPEFLPSLATEQPGAAETAVTVVAPASSLSPDQSAAIGAPIRLEQFALDLESAIPSIRVASGKVLVDGAPSNDLWAVVFGVGGISSLSVAPTFNAGLPTGPCPWFFAIRPLSTKLVSASNLVIQPLVDGKLVGPGVVANINGVDMEIWARSFLSDFDRMLTPAYAAGLYRLNAPEIRNRIDELIGCKSMLADAIAGGLDFILVSETQDEKRRTSAVDMLRQQLLSSLANGYAVSVVMQWDATEVKSSWSTKTAKLVGVPKQKAGGAPNVSIGSTKVNLADQSSKDSDPFVNATLTVTNAQELGSLTFDAEFSPNEIEFDIAPVPGVVGFASSNWLRFIHPLADTPPAGYDISLGTVVAPLPLRSYPAMPQLQSHTTSAESPETTDVAAASRWRYAVDVAHPGVLQDELIYKIQVNLQPSGLQGLASQDQLIAALAQYNAISADLWTILETLPSAQAGLPPDSKLVAAIGTFIDQAQAVSRAWGQLWSPSTVEVEAGTIRVGLITQDFVLSSQLTANEGRLTNLTLSADGNAPAPGGWPSMDVDCGGRAIRLEGLPPSGDSRNYRFPENQIVATNTDLVYELGFSALEFGQFQNAQTAVAVIRNAHLMPNGGPAAREPFIFRTPFFAFSDNATPLVINSNRMPIPSFTAQDPKALADMFNAIFAGSGTGMQISVAVNYNFLLAPNGVGDPLAPSLPVLLMPRTEYSPDFPAKLAQSLNTWLVNNAPSKAGGEWQICVSLYSAIEWNLDRPILRLERIISPLPNG